MDIGTIASVFEVSGEGTFIGGRYTHLLIGRGDYSHSVGLGIEDRSFDNTVGFGGVDLGADVRSRPVALRYQGGLQKGWGRAGFHVEYARNLGGGNNNDRASYAASRAGADRSWHALRYGVHVDHGARGWLVRARLNGQWSAEELIPGEQFGVGGAVTVRGYEEREVTGDRGNQTSVELWTPAWYRGVRFLAFTDFGRVTFGTPVAGVTRTTIASVGAGLRWTWAERLSAGLDVANALAAAPETEAGDVVAHFNLLYRFW